MVPPRGCVDVTLKSETSSRCSSRSSWRSKTREPQSSWNMRRHETLAAAALQYRAVSRRQHNRRAALDPALRLVLEAAHESHGVTCSRCARLGDIESRFISDVDDRVHPHHGPRKRRRNRLTDLQAMQFQVTAHTVLGNLDDDLATACQQLLHARE